MFFIDTTGCSLWPVDSVAQHFGQRVARGTRFWSDNPDHRVRHYLSDLKPRLQRFLTEFSAVWAYNPSLFSVALIRPSMPVTHGNAKPA